MSLRAQFDRWKEAEKVCDEARQTLETQVQSRLDVVVAEGHVWHDGIMWHGEDGEYAEVAVILNQVQARRTAENASTSTV